MLPLIPFAAGLITGVVALRLFKSDKPRAVLDKAQGRLRDATVSSLDSVSSASTRMRDRLLRQADAETQEDAGAEAPMVDVTPAPFNDAEDRGER